MRTGTTPHAIATATQGQARGASIRREDVKTATPNMKAGKRQRPGQLAENCGDHQSDRRQLHNGTYGRGGDGTLDLQPANPRSGNGQHDQDHQSDKKRQSRLMGHNSVSQQTARQPRWSTFGGEPGSYDVAKCRSSHGQGRSSPAIVPLPQELGDGDLDGARHRHGEQGTQDAGQFGTEQDGDDHYERR